MPLKRIVLVPLLVSCLLASRVVEAKILCVDTDAACGSSQAVVVDPVALAHTAQLLPLDAEGEVVGKGDIHKQTEQVLDALDKVLHLANSDLRHTVKLNIYVAHSDLSAAVAGVLAKRFSGKVKPAVTYVAGDMAQADVLVAMDAIAVSKSEMAGHVPVQFAGKNGTESRVALLPPNGVVYVAGMADTNTLELATGATLRKIEAAIGHLGLKRQDIVQLKVFLLPMSDIGKVKAAVAEHFKGEIVPPMVYLHWLSPSVPVEIEAIVAAPAVVGEQGITFHTPPGTSASPVYSRLARVHSGKRIYISGLYGKSESAQDVAEIYGQLDELIKKTGSSRDHLAKATYYPSDNQSNARLDAFRPKYYNPKTPPAASKAKVKDAGQPGKGIVIDIIAVAK